MFEEGVLQGALTAFESEKAALQRGFLRLLLSSYTGRPFRALSGYTEPVHVNSPSA